jgi:KDO2-lipid IV(A) lauroyltransferase
MKRVRHTVEYRLVRVTLALVRIMPWRVASTMGTALGWLFYTLDGRHRRVALQNVAAAFPRRTAAEHRTLVRRVFGHFGRLLFLLLKFSGLRRDAMLDRVEFEGVERVHAAHAQGRGALFFTGHFGFWEIHAIAHGAAIATIGVLARPLDNPHLHALVERMRGCTGFKPSRTSGSARDTITLMA